MSKLTEWLQAKKKICDGATEGPWESTFIGGPLIPNRIEIDEVGRHGSPHITIRRDQKFIDSGFFGTTDAELIADSRTSLPIALEIIRRQAHVIKSAYLELDLDPSKIAKELEDK